jgi:hypothetical protein
MATLRPPPTVSLPSFCGARPAQGRLPVRYQRGMFPMDGEPEPEREVTRVPTDADLVSLARELNRLGVAYVVIGGFAINRLGFVRATEDIDLLVARDKANQSLVKKALEILPDRAIKELGDEDIAQWVVVRVNDDITVDLMTEACGVRFEDAGNGIEIEIIDGVPIPFAGAELMLKMKKCPREKDSADRVFLQKLIRDQKAD